MYKKENKRSLKSPLYLQSRPKKTKKLLLFSTVSMPFLKVTNGTMLNDYVELQKPFIKSARIQEDAGSKKSDRPNRNLKLMKKQTQKQKNSDHMIKQRLKNNDYYWSKQKTIECSRQKFLQTPRPGADSQIRQYKPQEDLLNSKTIDSIVYQNQIKRLQTSIQKFKNMHQNSLKKLSQVQKKAKTQELKHERAKQIYIERIKTLTKSLRSNKRNIGHLFTFEDADKNIVPDRVILEVSSEEQSQSILEFSNQVQILQEYYKSTQSSIISQLSLNSKQSFE